MVSIIIPVYNAQKTLLPCVQSVLDQTYKDWELILIDDGSQDGSGLICDQVQERCRADHMLCQVIHQPNRGVSAARNCGMEHARGEYFVFVDSDDRIEPCYLEVLVQTAKAHPEFSCVICGFQSISNHHKYVFSEREALTTASRRDYMRLFEAVLIQSPCLALYRTEVVRRCNIKMREDLSLAEDLIFNLEYLDALGEVPIGVINKANYVYFDEDPQSLNRKYREDLLHIQETVNQTLADFLEKWGVDDDASWRMFFNSAFYRYQRVLDNTFSSRNTMSRREKIAYNNAVLNKKEFRETLQKCTVPLTPSRRRALESGDYRRVLFADRIQKLKEAISAVLRR